MFRVTWGIHLANIRRKIHIHMVDFQILSRSDGRDAVEPYEKTALKDVAVLGPNEAVTIAVTFVPFAGLYMFHCHNLVHEDHAMMAALNLTGLQGLGYSASDLNFADPMEAQWRAANYAEVEAQSILGDVLPRFAATNAYQNLSLQGDQASNAASDGLSPRTWWLSLLVSLIYTVI